MSIEGVASAVFAAPDLERQSRFWVDFGLRPADGNPQEEFSAANGSRVCLKDLSSPDCPISNFEGAGLRETVWGVSDRASLRVLADRIAADRNISEDADGVLRFRDNDGGALGLVEWRRHPVLSVSDPVNTPGEIRRLNQLRRWRTRAIPKAIAHVVFAVEDYVAAADFYRNVLGFRVTDHSRGFGVFLRADGAPEHHSIFLADAGVLKRRAGFHHIAFSVDDIDEIMAGANHLDRCGWPNAKRARDGGLCRHRISSAAYHYWPIPDGAGDAEYNCDTDYLDDSWVPRVWEPTFGAWSWASSIQTVAPREVEWDVQFDPGARSLEEVRHRSRYPEPAAAADGSERRPGEGR